MSEHGFTESGFNEINWERCCNLHTKFAPCSVCKVLDRCDRFPTGVTKWKYSKASDIY